MTEQTWSVVDDYFGRQLGLADRFSFALKRNAAHGLRAMDVSAAQGRLLQLMAQMSGARRVLEVGTLGGYSTLWLASALPPGGLVVTLELDPLHASVARENFAEAGLSAQIVVKEGAAADTLAQLVEEGTEPFDFVFIDADKPSNVTYLQRALQLSRPGTIIVLDNVVRDGQVANAGSSDASVLGSRAAFDFIANQPRFTATAIQTVGSKGYDGFAVIRVS